MTNAFDTWCIHTVESLHTPVLNNIMIFITSLGDHGAVWIVISLIFLLFKNRRIYGLLSLISLALGALTGELLLKHLIARPRPFIQFETLTPLVSASNYSFPSMHTACAFAAAFILFKMNKKIGIAAYGLAVLIALSRIYLLVHFPTDILAGVVLGTLCALAVWLVYKKFTPAASGMSENE
ncbi:MAG TPA: phosphatase PAP2 family protein [Ruminococcaceae bacterium]|nr:phosphatase PAP2 family protein [Oscillospiraceae bacterium]